MGNKVLIIALTSMAIITSIILMIRSNSTSITDLSTENFNSLQAQYIANSGIQIYLNKLRFNKNLRGEFEDLPLFGGKFSVKISGEDTVTLRVKSEFMNRRYQVSVSTIWDNIVIPPIKAGMTISSANIDLKLNGNILVSGIDKNPDVTLGPVSAVSGISVDSLQDSVRIFNEIPNNVKPNVIGAGTTPSIGVNQPPSNLMELLNQYIQSADIVLQSGTYSTGIVLGTPDNPKITYIRGNANFAGNASGAGILIVFGDLSCAGNFTYQGLVIVYGNTAISASASGNSAIYGSMLVIGPSVNISATGSAIINYSSKTIQNISQKLKNSKFLVSYWVDW
jgi:hypothetical protein